MKDTNNLGIIRKIENNIATIEPFEKVVYDSKGNQWLHPYLLIGEINKDLDLISNWLAYEGLHDYYCIEDQERDKIRFEKIRKKWKNMNSPLRT